jgi:hypothetical protein
MVPLVVMTAPTPKPAGNERLEALARLRNDGSLTRSEFDTLKAKIMRED